MRGDIDPQPSMFSYVDLESRIPRDQPIRKIRKIADGALTDIAPWHDDMYSTVGRHSISPEMLIRASLLQVFYSTRSKRQLVQRIDYDLLFSGHLLTENCNGFVVDAEASVAGRSRGWDSSVTLL